ncbi:DNA topoisomerase, partial [Fusarium falciforme]
HGFEAIGLEDSFAKPSSAEKWSKTSKKICEGHASKTDVVKDIVEKYRKYWHKTNACKNTLLQVYDRVKASM